MVDRVLPHGRVVSVQSEKHPGCHFIGVRDESLGGRRKIRFLCKVYEDQRDDGLVDPEALCNLIKNALVEQQRKQGKKT